MAHAGFPWRSQSQAQDAINWDEKKAAERLDSYSSAPHPLADATNRSSISSYIHHGKLHSLSHGSLTHGKRRAGSLRAQPAPRRPTMTIPDAGSGRERSDQMVVRTIPPWVRDAEEDDVDEQNISMPDSPHAAFVAQHNHSPSTTRHPLLDGEDREEKGHITSSGQVRPERTSRWISFARASAYPRETFGGVKVGDDWLDQNFTDYSKPWLAGHDEDDDVEDDSGRYRAFRKKRQVWYKRSQYTILRNPFIPLVFRLLVISFAIIAIGLGASIFRESDKILACIKQDERSPYCQSLVGVGDKSYYRDPSALMAIIVDVIAVAYSIYVTYDEYFSKPLGLRSARAKVRLVLFDLFFIVFQAANLSLSFEALSFDAGPCKSGDTERTSGRFESVCDQAQALSSVLLVSLVAWLLTFSVSILRLVERINTR